MNKVTDVLNEFLVQQGYNDELTALYNPDEESYYNCEERLVVFGGLTNRYADELFMKYCKTLGLVIPVHIETLTFLHEVGHHLTVDFLDEEEIVNSEWTKFLLNLKDDWYTEKDYMSYFACPVEYEATMDAVKFCNNCPKVVMDLDKKIQKALYGKE